jgi:hypothetical protein
MKYFFKGLLVMPLILPFLFIESLLFLVDIVRGFGGCPLKDWWSMRLGDWVNTKLKEPAQ